MESSDRVQMLMETTGWMRCIGPIGTEMALAPRPVALARSYALRPRHISQEPARGRTIHPTRIWPEATPAIRIHARLTGMAVYPLAESKLMIEYFRCSSRFW
jgi:hypothetical protein